jgi:hypothetical protein
VSRLDGPWPVRLLLLYFAARTVLLACTLAPDIPPDETLHMGRAEAYGAVLGIPADNAATHHLGVLRFAPPLYYWVMGKLLRLNATPLDDLLWLRLWNAALGFATALVAVRAIRRLVDDPLARLVALAVVTNTLMFTGVCASVSYDNAVNLLAALAIDALLAFLPRNDAGALVRGALCAAAGCLVKASFVPLALLLTAALLFRQGRMWTAVRRSLASWLDERPVGRGAGLLLLAALVAANLVLYGGNLARFGSLEADPEAVLGLDAALANRMFARDWIFDGFVRGDLTLAAARRRAAAIDDAGARATTLWLLANEQQRRQGRAEAQRMGPLAYALGWSELMLRRSLGYTGHRRLMKSDVALIPYAVFLAVAALGAARRWRPATAPDAVSYAGWVAFLYATALLWLFNYPTYLRLGFLDVAVQGRYLFPVLVPLGALAVRYAGGAPPAALRPGLLLAVAALFLWGDGPWFWASVPADWLTGP